MGDLYGPFVVLRIGRGLQPLKRIQALKVRVGMRVNAQIFKNKNASLSGLPRTRKMVDHLTSTRMFTLIMTKIFMLAPTITRMWFCLGLYLLTILYYLMSFISCDKYATWKSNHLRPTHPTLQMSPSIHGLTCSHGTPMQWDIHLSSTGVSRKARVESSTTIAIFHGITHLFLEL